MQQHDGRTITANSDMQGRSVRLNVLGPEIGQERLEVYRM
jgi:hypothetical protein